ncbi:hypothetical protein DV735_g4295, partial [Chaetothyriales sp. CBS 134920]
MTTPTPPVPFEDQCSIIHNNTLYVYSPNAFQTLSLEEGARWKQETNGVSVVGAQCVYGGVDGLNNQSALYVVGGVANESNSNYPGLQRYSLQDKSWETISPLVQVTRNRQFHGATYINASSGIIIYGGSQQGATGLSSETFFVELYPPYRVQAYSSIAPPVKNPFMMPWSNDRALMVGGSSSNLNAFTFGPLDGWQSLGVTLPTSLPNSSVAQAALLSLDDGSKILQTFNLSQHPVSVSSNVLLNPGGAAANGQVIGVATTTTTTGASAATGTANTRRALALNTFPIYDGADGPNTTRTGSSIAQSEDGLLAFVGGDTAGSVSFFNQSQNAWVLPDKILGDQTTSSSATNTATATATQSSTSGSQKSDKHSDRAAILGGVLGGVFGLVAIVLVVAFYIWLARIRKRVREQKQPKESYEGRTENDDFEGEEGLKSLSANGQPMGRSPVSSAVINKAHTSEMFVQNPTDLIRPDSKGSSGGGKTEAQKAAPTHRLFHREKAPPTISKPMNPELGDYSLRQSPNIDLGRATPAAPLNSTALISAVAASNLPTRSKSHRRTDEAWAKYFSTDAVKSSLEDRHASPDRLSRAGAAATLGPGGGEAVTRVPSWPAMRDSTGRALEMNSVTTNSPVLENSPSRARKGMASGRMSGADSIDEYEDDVVDDGLSSGTPSMTRQQRWTPLDHGWSQPTVERAPIAAKSSSDNTSGSKLSAIPNFPMPGSTARTGRRSGGEEVISNLGSNGTTHPLNPRRSNPPRGASLHPSSATAQQDDARQRLPDDLSWLNLGAQDTPRTEEERGSRLWPTGY